MRKKLAALLCGVMCITAFTGCSRTELEYLKMSSDLLDTMSACVVEGSMQADVDFDALYEFEEDVAKATGVNDQGRTSEEKPFTGKKTLAVDYEMNMNIDTLEYDMSFDVNYGGKTYDLGKLYYSLDKGMFVTSESLWGVYQIITDAADGHQDKYVMSESFAKDLKEILSEERYIALVSLEDLTGVEMDEVLPEQDMSALYDAVFTFYEDLLDGFETGMVKKINSGYRIEADGRAVADLLVRLLEFAADHPDQIIDATETYLMAVMDAAETGTAEDTAAAKAEIAALFAEARASREDFTFMADQLAVLLKEAVQDEGVGMVLDSFKYSATVKKASSSFDSVAAYTVKHNGKTVCSLVTDSVMKKADVQIFFPLKAMTIEDLTEKLCDLENKYNPVSGVSVTWGKYGETTTADIRAMRSTAEGVFFNNDYSWSELIVENGRAYLPLRMIAEALGEEVGWENSTKTPFVVKDGERIDMKGKLQDSKAYVGIRDFEKLGYTVTYTSHKDEFDSFFDYKEALITK